LVALGQRLEVAPRAGATKGAKNNALAVNKILTARNIRAIIFVDRNKMKIYIGSWIANSGSTYSADYKFTSLRAAKKSMRALCRGNVFAGNTGAWYVRCNGDVIASGSVKN